MILTFCYWSLGVSGSLIKSGILIIYSFFFFSLCPDLADQFLSSVLHFIHNNCSSMGPSSFFFFYNSIAWSHNHAIPSFYTVLWLYLLWSSSCVFICHVAPIFPYFLFHNHDGSKYDFFFLLLYIWIFHVYNVFLLQSWDSSIFLHQSP